MVRAPHLLSFLAAALLLACAAPAPSAAPAAAPRAPASGAAPPAAPAAGGASAAPASGDLPATPETVEYGYTSISAIYWATYVAQARGYYDEQRLIVSETSTGSAAAGTLAVVSGSLDIVGANPDPVIRSVANGADLVMVAGTVNPPIYGLFGAKHIRDVQELRGQTLMMGGPKDVTLLIFDRMIAPHGLRRADFDFVYAGGTPDRYRALQSGAVAATLLFQPYDFVAKRDGYPLLLSSYDYLKDLVFSSFTVSRSWLENEANRGRLVRFLTALYRASQAVCDPANKEEMVRILAEKTRLSEEDARASYDLLITESRSMKCDLRITPEEVHRVAEYIGEMGDLTPPYPDARRMVDMSFLDQAVARLR